MLNRAFLVSAALTVATAALPQTPRDSGSLDLEALLAIRHPSDASWSPDGARVAFLWDRGGVENLYLVATVGGWPEPLTDYPEGLLSAPFWSRDGSLLYYERGGELWSIPPEKGSTPRPVFGTEAAESGARLSPDGRYVAFLRLGDVWIRHLATGKEKRLTVTLVTESDIRWSPDGQRIAFVYARSTPREDEYDYVGQKLAFRRSEQEPSDVGVVSVSGGEVLPIAASSSAE